MKSKVRARRRLKQRMRRAGACEACAPMLPFEAPAGADGVITDLPCQTCGRVMRLHLVAGAQRTDRMIEELLRGLASTGRFCMLGYKVTSEGETVTRVDCDCDLDHVELQFHGRINNS